MRTDDDPVRPDQQPGPPGDADTLAPHEVSRFRAAAGHARRVLPGALGQLVARELEWYATFGHRVTADALVPRLAAEVLTMRSANGS